jgi:hypothetical protein
MYLFIESLKGLFHYNGSIYLQHNAVTKKKAGLEEMGH